MDALAQARRELEEALGDSVKEYFFNLRQWFHVKISKEMFDAKSRKLLPAGMVQFHNNFLLALLNKCHLSDSVAENVWTAESGTSAVKKRRVHDTGSLKQDQSSGSDPTPFTYRFQPADVRWGAPDVAVQPTPPPSSPPPPLSDLSQLSVQRQRVLPDRPLIHGRMLLEAWQAGVEQVEESAVDLLHVALQQCLKNVLMSVMCRKTGYQLRHNRIVHNIGHSVPNPWLINASRLHQSEHGTDGVRDVRDGERMDRLRAACADQRDPSINTITLQDLLHALKTDPSMLPCYPVYSLLLERTSSRLWHPVTAQ